MSLSIPASVISAVMISAVCSCSVFHNQYVPRSMKADLSLYDYHVAACVFCEVSDALHLANENGTGDRRRNHCEIGLGESVQRGGRLKYWN